MMDNYSMKTPPIDMADVENMQTDIRKAILEENKRFIKKKARDAGEEYAEFLHRTKTHQRQPSIAAVEARMESALELYLPFIFERYSEKGYSQQEVKEYIGLLNELIFAQYTHTLNTQKCEMAVVIWLLDYFNSVRRKEETERLDAYMKARESGTEGEKPLLSSQTYERFQAILPVDFEILDDMEFFTDFQYSDDEKAQMIHLYRGRNDEYSGQFEKLLELIEPALKRRLTQVFATATFIAIDVDMRLFSTHQKAIKDAETDLKNAFIRLIAAREIDFDKANELLSKRGMKPINTSIIKSAPTILFSSQVPTKMEFLDISDKLDDLEFEDPAEDFFALSSENFGLTERSCRKNCGRVVSAAISEYEKLMEDYLKSEQAVDPFSPYDMCFAALLLERENAPILAFDAPAAMTLSYAVSLLPWAFDMDAEVHICESRADSFQRRYVEDPVFYTKKERNFSLGASEYSPTADVELDEEDMKWAKERDAHRLTFGQLTFITAGFTLPRDRVISRSVIDFATAMGASEAEAHEIAGIAMVENEFGSRNARSFSDSMLPDIDDINESEKLSPEADDEITAEAISITAAEQIAAQAAQISEIKRQLNAAKAAHYAVERENAQLTGLLNEMKMMRKAETAELAELRELFFKQNTEEVVDLPDSDDTTELFPYRTEHRIIVFGGHESWRNAIKQMLPNVRFYDNEVLSSPEIIRNAEVVFFQSNSISHKLFNVLIDETRRTKTEYHYLNYSSPRKCAVQIVEWDKVK